MYKIDKSTNRSFLIYPSQNRENVFTIIVVLIEKLESHVPFVPKARAHIALHVMEQIQIVHQLMENIASATLDPKKIPSQQQSHSKTLKIKTFIQKEVGSFVSYLNEHGAVGVSVWIDGPSGALAADVARESYAHAAARGLSEERPREGGDRRIGSGFEGGRSLHARTRRPASADGGAQHQAHCRVLRIQKKKKNEDFLVYCDCKIRELGFSGSARWKKEQGTLDF